MTRKYVSTKAYKELGSIAYRQWRADSHCRLIHGYALSFYFEFESDTIDVRNWVVDYGSLRSFKDKLEEWFDHKLLVAEDDPERELQEQLAKAGLAEITIVGKTGCEGIAEFLWDYLEEYWLPDNGYRTEDHWVDVRKVQVQETEANKAFLTKD